MLRSSFCPFLFRSQPKERASDLHPLPNSGTGKGVPLQQVPHAQAQDRDRACAVPDGAANQDLVPKPTNEVEEGVQTTRSFKCGSLQVDRPGERKIDSAEVFRSGAVEIFKLYLFLLLLLLLLLHDHHLDIIIY